MTSESSASAGGLGSIFGIVFINLGSLSAQIVQVAGFPTLLALSLARLDHAPWVIGTLLSLQWLVVLVLAPLLPAFMNRVGIRSASQSGAMLSIAALALLLISDAIAMVALASLLMGAGLTMRWIACDTWIVGCVAERRRGTAIGIHETLMGLGTAIGPLLTMLSGGNKIAAILAYLALMAAAVLCFAFGTPCRQSVHEGRPREIAIVFRVLALALLAAVVAGFIETAMVSMLPIYLMGFNYAEAQALILLSIFGLGGTLLQTPLGWIADRWSFRAGQVLCLVLLLAGSVLIPATIAWPGAIMAILFVWGGAAGGLNTLAVIEAGATLPAARSGAGMALIASSYTLGGVAGPVASGTTMHLWHGHGAMFVILALMTFYAAMLARSRFRI